MKTVLILSLLLNAGLLVTTACLYFRPAGLPAQKIAPQATVEVVAKAPQSRQQATPDAPKQVIQWSQVESDNFPTYIANMRAVGCPEPTIQKIVTAELREIYAEKRQQLEKESLDAKKAQPYGSPSVAKGPGLAEKIQNLQREENAVLAGLLQPSGVATASNASASSPAETATARSSSSAQVRWPAAYHVDPVASKLDEAQQASINQLKADFIKDIGGENQDPQDPAYRKRWVKAVSLADEIFRTRYGDAAYAAYQMEAIRAARKLAATK